MSNAPIKENEFFGAPGGTAGTVSYGTTYGTPAGPNTSQDPSHFQGSDNNKAVNQGGNTAKELPQTGSMEKDLNAIYAKKDTPSPDEIITGIKHEMGAQIKKDKALAKQAVLANLKKDPHFYSNLKMLNIDDKSMVDNMNESKHPNDGPARPKVTPNIKETKKIFAEMEQAYGKKYVVNSQISDVMKEMWEAKQQRNAWRNSK